MAKYVNKKSNNCNEENEWNQNYEICRKFHIALSSDDVAREEACLSAAMFEMKTLKRR